MKKSVILMVFVVYLAAILVVGIFGLQMRVLDRIIYAETIVCNTENAIDLKKALEDENLSEASRIDYQDLVDNRGCSYYIRRTDFVAGMKIELKFSVKPEDATNTSLVYSAPRSENFVLTDNGNGTAIVTINAATAFTVTVESGDKRASTKIRIRVIDLSIFY